MKRSTKNILLIVGPIILLLATWYLFHTVFPLLLLCAFVIVPGMHYGRFLLRTTQNTTSRVVFGITGIFGIIGIILVTCMLYSVLDWNFRGKTYTYMLTHLNGWSPSGLQKDPRTDINPSGYTHLISSFDVRPNNGQPTLLTFPQKDGGSYVSVVSVWTPGKMLFGTFSDNQFTFDETQTERTSLWWLLTHDPYSLTSKAENTQ